MKYPGKTIVQSATCTYAIDTIRQFLFLARPRCPLNQSFPFCGIVNVFDLPKGVVHALAHGLDLVALTPGSLAVISLAILGLTEVSLSGEWVLLRLGATLHGMAHYFIVSQAAASFCQEINSLSPQRLHLTFDQSLGSGQSRAACPAVMGDFVSIPF